MRKLFILFIILFTFQTMESQKIEKDSINTRKEKAMLLAALAEELGVDTNLINMAKAELKKSGLGK